MYFSGNFSSFDSNRKKCRKFYLSYCVGAEEQTKENNVKNILATDKVERINGFEKNRAIHFMLAINCWY